MSAALSSADAKSAPCDGLTAPRGFRAAGAVAGLKGSGAMDLALVVNDGPLAAAAVFAEGDLQVSSARCVSIWRSSWWPMPKARANQFGSMRYLRRRLRMP